jgi:ABC-type uncharacterized transport system fused permease/ATPase subunit
VDIVTVVIHVNVINIGVVLPVPFMHVILQRVSKASAHRQLNVIVHLLIILVLIVIFLSALLVAINTLADALPQIPVYVNLVCHHDRAHDLYHSSKPTFTFGQDGTVPTVINQFVQEDVEAMVYVCHQILVRVTQDGLVPNV